MNPLNKTVKGLEKKFFSGIKKKIPGKCIGEKIMTTLKSSYNGDYVLSAFDSKQLEDRYYPTNQIKRPFRHKEKM